LSKSDLVCVIEVGEVAVQYQAPVKVSGMWHGVGECESVSVQAVGTSATWWQVELFRSARVRIGTKPEDCSASLCSTIFHPNRECTNIIADLYRSKRIGSMVACEVRQDEE